MPFGSCGDPSSYLENALTGRRWAQPVPDIVWGARNDQKISGLEDQKKIFCITLSTMTCSGIGSEDYHVYENNTSRI
jgi:hypothetical protein